MKIKINGHSIYDKMDVKVERLKPVSFVEMCLQNAAYLVGRGDIKEAIDDIQRGKLCLVDQIITKN